MLRDQQIPRSGRRIKFLRDQSTAGRNFQRKNGWFAGRNLQNRPVGRSGSADDSFAKFGPPDERSIGNVQGGNRAVSDHHNSIPRDRRNCVKRTPRSVPEFFTRFQIKAIHLVRIPRRHQHPALSNPWQ